MTDDAKRARVKLDDDIFFKKVGELDLSVRAANCFKNEHITYIGDLVLLTPGQLLRIPNFGWKTLREVEGELAHWGLHLGMEPKQYQASEQHKAREQYEEQLRREQPSIRETIEEVFKEMHRREHEKYRQYEEMLRSRYNTRDQELRRAWDDELRRVKQGAWDSGQLKRLRDAMVAAHPDKGGTADEFIKARDAYMAAKKLVH